MEKMEAEGENEEENIDDWLSGDSGSGLRGMHDGGVRADGVKPFMVMTDAQMAELAKMENPALADMKKIEGFGEARAEKYGERLLAAKTAESANAKEIEETELQ